MHTRDIAKMAHETRVRRHALLAIDSLGEYVRMMWPVVEPGVEMTWNWHVDLICDELERVTSGETRELVICVPPGFAKSLLVSVFFPTWRWLKKPWMRGLHISNSDRLCVRDSRRAKSIVQSNEYIACIDAAHDTHGVPRWALSHDQAEKVHFANTEHGARLAIPTSARVTGDRGDMLVIDDPVDAQEAVLGTSDQIKKRMDEVMHKYDYVWASRLNDLRTNPRVTIMQRLHHLDLAGRLIDRGVRHVVLPMEYDPDHPHRHPDDPRAEKGELLFVGRFPREVVDSEKRKPLAGRHYNAQYQQLPSADTGGMFQRDYFRYYTTEAGLCYAQRLPSGGVRRVLVADCWRIMVADTAMTEGTRSDYTVIQVWDVERVRREDGEVVGGDMFLVDQWRERRETPAVESQLRTMHGQHNPVFIGIEDKGSGMVINQRFRLDGLPIKPIKADKDKVTRATIAEVWMSQGRVWLPEGSAYLPELEGELLSFPDGEHDDQVDTLAHAVSFAHSRDMWTRPKIEFPAGSFGHKHGHDKLLFGHKERKSSPFSLDD